MYRANDKQAAIREIKKYLYAVAHHAYTDIPKTTIDGFYDIETANAIRAFQSISNLPITGEVDLDTFEALYSVYDMSVTDFNTNDYIIEDAGFPVLPGDMGDDVRIIHILINELSERFSTVDKVSVGNYYTDKTEDAMRILRRIFGFSDGKGVDKPLYLRMIAEIDAYKRNNLTD